MAVANENYEFVKWYVSTKNQNAFNASTKKRVPSSMVVSNLEGYEEFSSSALLELPTRDKLRALRRRLHESGVDVPCFGTCDTVPIHEKAWAVLGGLGWLGRSCLLVTPAHGTPSARA